MTLHRLLSKHAWPLSVLDLASWPDLEWSLLNPAARDRYRRLKAAISRVVRDRSTLTAAAREWGIDASELDRALDRCFEPADDGRIQGFRALRPYLRLKAYTRHPDTKGGTAGILQALLERFPRINEQLWQSYREGRSIRELHDALLNEWLPAVGWPRHGYPYNTSSKGREGLRQYLRRLEMKLCGKQWTKQGGEEGKRVIVRPFQRVELDAHKCDAHFIVHIDGPEGLSRTLVLERIWLLVLIDVASRAALGYALCLNRQCGIPDVLEAVHNAIVPQPVRELTIPGLAYKPGAGLPNQLIPICAWQLLDLLALDNAMAHRSPRVHQILNERTQCVITLNRGGTPNDNPFVERFFGTLTAHGLKRTPSTTGSGPDDPRRKDSEELAEHYEFSLGDAEQLLAVQIANYNVEVHGGIYTSPLEYLRTYYREVPAITRHVPLAEREGFSLKELWVEVTIRGSIDDEKRPYLASEATRSGNSNLVVFIDDAQDMRLDDLGFLANIYNCLKQRDVQQYTFLVGEHTLPGLRERANAAGSERYVGRFMCADFEFPLIRSEKDLAFVFRQYDSFGYPEGNSRSITETFLPKAFAGGWRLESQAGAMWRGFRSGARSVGKKTTRMTMQSCTILVAHLLQSSALKDAPDLNLTDKDIQSAARMVRYLHNA